MEAVALRMQKDDDDDDNNEERESKLMDRYERMSFEIQLNKAIHFGRSLSQPHISTTISSSNADSFSTNNYDITPPPPPPPITIITKKEKDVRQEMPTARMSSRSGTSSSNGQRNGFNKALKKLLKPVLWRKKLNSSTTSTDVPSLNATQNEPQLSNHNTTSWKKFRRSLRV